MNYIEAVDYIVSNDKFGTRLELEGMEKLLTTLGSPQDKLKYIHIGGTNGKGSTTSYISDILIDAGYKVGMFTSPYIERFNERIKINKLDIADEVLARLARTVKTACDEMVLQGYNQPSTFEIITAIGFIYFVEEDVDIVALEVGLGGRYDATNVIKENLASVITTINFDHIDVLGNTLSEIAYQKAGIFKNDSVNISYMQKDEVREVLKSESELKNCSFNIIDENDIYIKNSNDLGSTFDYKNIKDISIKMIGKYQVYNASLAIETIMILRERGKIKVTDENIINGIARTKWIGRMDVLGDKPTFIIDGAHNVESAKALKDSLSLFNYDRLILGIGILKDKDYREILNNILDIADIVIATEAKIPRKLDAKELYNVIKESKEEVYLEEDIDKAVEKALEIATENDLIIFSGSLYIIGGVRILYNNKYKNNHAGKICIS